MIISAGMHARSDRYRLLASVISVSAGLPLLYAATVKTIDPTEAFAAVTTTLSIPAFPGSLMISAIVLSELVIGTCLIVLHYPKILLLGSCLYMALAIYLVHVGVNYPDVSCGCFGLSDHTTRSAHLTGAGRNILLAGSLCLAAIALQSNQNEST